MQILYSVRRSWEMNRIRIHVVRCGGVRGCSRVFATCSYITV